jgi:hypothetical protein
MCFGGLWIRIFRRSGAAPLQYVFRRVVGSDLGRGSAAVIRYVFRGVVVRIFRRSGAAPLQKGACELRVLTNDHTVEGMIWFKWSSSDV